MWQRYTWILMGFVPVALCCVTLFILLIDPYGISPTGLPIREPILHTNQRYVYPQIVRNGGFDSYVIGTSTSRLLEPPRLDRALGGKFANLAMNDARAWEQKQLMDLILRDAGPPRTLLIGLDTVWCREDADTYQVSRTRTFPHWMYDGADLTDLRYMLNLSTLNLAFKKLQFQLGRNVRRFDPDGFADFTDGEKKYDPERARKRIWDGRENARIPVTPAFEVEDPSAHWTLPALPWLEDVLARTQGKSRVLLVFMPVHLTAQPRPGSDNAAREHECKRRIQDLAMRYNAFYADYRNASQMNTNDLNYWDPLHWRIHVGRSLLDELGARLTHGGEFVSTGTMR